MPTPAAVVHHPEYSERIARQAVTVTLLKRQLKQAEDELEELVQRALPFFVPLTR